MAAAAVPTVGAAIAGLGSSAGRRLSSREGGAICGVRGLTGIAEIMLGKIGSDRARRIAPSRLYIELDLDEDADGIDMGRSSAYAPGAG